MRLMNISYWATANKRTAQIIILCLYALLTMLAIYTGRLIASMGMEVPAWVFYSSLLLFTYVFIRYPYRYRSQKSESRKSSFAKRKSYDFIAALTGYLMIIQVSNYEKISLGNIPYWAGGTVALGLEPQHSNRMDVLKKASVEWKAKEKLKEKQGWWKEKKAQLKTNITLFKKHIKDRDGQKALLTLLTILGGIGLLFLLAMLSCEISCSGAETLAVIILIGGTFLIIFGATLIILRIYKGKRLKKRSAKSAAVHVARA